VQIVQGAEHGRIVGTAFRRAGRALRTLRQADRSKHATDPSGRADPADVQTRGQDLVQDEARRAHETTGARDAYPHRKARDARAPGDATPAHARRGAAPQTAAEAHPRAEAATQVQTPVGAQIIELLPPPATATRSAAAPPVTQAPAAQPPGFRAAPPAVAAAASAVIEPALAVAVLAVLTLAWGAEFGRAESVLALLVFALWRAGSGRLHLRLREAAADLLAQWAVVAGVLLAAGWLTDSLTLFDPGLLAAWAVLTPAVGVAALGLTQVLHRRWAQHPARRRRAIVVGAGPLAARLSQALRGRASTTELVAFFDDRLDDRLDPGAARQRRGALADVAEFVRQQHIDDVYVALPLDGSAAAGSSGAGSGRGRRRAARRDGSARESSHVPAARGGDAPRADAPRVAAVLQALQGTTASVFHVPDILGLTIVQGRLRDVGGVPVIGLCESPYSGMNAVLKRAEDLVLASLILLAIAPLLAVVALGVKLSSPGPVIFRQRRNGLDGREIVVWKFRSMRTMDNGAVVRQATRDDPRVTPFGAFIRRTSLDELPQFFNVLQGRMSIVGPRPHAVAHNEAYRRLIGPYMVRHKVKPGITGWAQIHGHRGETDTLDKMRDRVAHDLEYLRHWSLGLDLRIVVRTALLMLADRQAY